MNYFVIEARRLYVSDAAFGRRFYIGVAAYTVDKARKLFSENHPNAAITHVSHRGVIDLIDNSETENGH